MPETGDEINSYTVQGDTIYLDKFVDQWQVMCVTEDGTVHWSLRFDDETKARAEFERWRQQP